MDLLIGQTVAAAPGVNHHQVSEILSRGSVCRAEIGKTVTSYKKIGAVRETLSPYASPVFFVKKKNGDPRLIVDFRKLNKQTERIHFPLPDIDEHLALIGDAKLFISLDLAHGYLQVPLTEEAMPKTAFITPDETGEFTRVMFGLMKAPFFFMKACAWSTTERNRTLVFR